MAQSTTPTQLGAAALGATFRSAREGAGVSVRTLAHAASISHSTVSRWERGDRDISLSTYEHLSRTLADLMAGCAA